ncbi:MAG TPA: bifunctional chorismate mutase/prephenate dehydrogenase [Candidatus Obscuribacterales bacterium]
MSQHELQQIDRELSELLSKRIAVLAKSEPTVFEEQLSKSIPLVTQIGIAKFLLQNIAAGCTPVLATAHSSLSGVKPRRVTVIGGRGMMGSFFTSRLSVAGHEVSILDRDDWNHADKLLSRAELVLVCVPIEHTLDAIRKASQYLNPTTALADITSIKAETVQAMLEHHIGPVVGLHPMFGSGVKSFLSQNVVVCPGREYETFQWLLDLIEGEGGKLIICTPEEHDRMMVVVQAIRHFFTFSLGAFLAEEGIDIERSLEFSSPYYRLQIDMVNRLFAQDASLSINLMLNTKERRDAINRLANTITRLAHLVTQQDKVALTNEFEAVRSVFKEQIPRSFKETNHVIENLSTFLVASKSESFPQKICANSTEQSCTAGK